MDKTKIDAARAALQHMDDCAMMRTAVDPVGPRGVLEQFIAEVERLADTHAVYMDQLPVAGAQMTADGIADADAGRIVPLAEVKAKRLDKTDDLLVRLQRAIDEAEHKPGDWTGMITMMGAITSKGYDFGCQESWGYFSYKRDAWLAIAAVNALPELMERVAVAEKGELEAMQALHRLEARQETLRNQLIACGVVANANTPESAAKARDMHPEYRSASCDDVVRAVDREMELRAKLDRLQAAERESWSLAGSAQPCCTDPGDCARPCEDKPSGELPAGLSWDQAPEWAHSLGEGKIGKQKLWFDDERYQYVSGDCRGPWRFGDTNSFARNRDGVVLITTRPTTKAPCADCHAIHGGPHACGKPGLHGAAEPEDDGWIKWDGGKCPVPSDARIQVKLRDGTIGSVGGMWHAPDYNWGHTGKQAAWEIIAYRPATPRRDATQN